MSPVTCEEYLPYRKLWFEVLRRAVDDYLRGPPMERSQAGNWIFSESRKDVHTYLCVCDELGVDPDVIRKGLKQRKGKR